jgi:hypothetical protein
MPVRPIRTTTLLLATLTLVAGCSTAGADPGASAATGATGSPTDAGMTGSTTTAAVLAASHDDEADYTWDPASEVAVTLADGASSGGSGVSVDADVVTIGAAGTYRIGGSLTDGSLVVDVATGGVVRLVLDGADIASATSAALAVVAAEKVVVILADGSENVLADAATHAATDAAEEPLAALASTADLTIAGDGSLVVDGRANDGISGKDGLIVAGGDVTVSAVDDGIRGKDYLIVTGGTLSVTAGGDALRADNPEDATLGYVTIAGGTLDLTAGTDAVDATTTASVASGSLVIDAGDDAIHAEVRVEVNGGTIDVERSYEGLEATQIVVTGGTIDIVADDDGLNVAGGNDGSALQGGDFTAPGGGPRGGGGMGPGGETAVDGWFVEVSGGTITIDAGGDGFDSNGSATVTGGMIVVSGPTSNGNGAIDVNGEFLISDAVLVAAGSAGMAETPSASAAQATLALTFDSSIAAGTVVRIEAPDGTAIATFVGAKPFQSLVVSSPAIEPGTAYEVLVGGTATGEDIGGLYLDPAYTPGTSVGTVSAITR